MSTPCCCHVWVLIPGLKYKILTLTWAQEARVLLNKTHSLNLLQMYPHTQMCKVFISDTLPHEERPSIPSWQHDTNRAVLHFFFLLTKFPAASDALSVSLLHFCLGLSILWSVSLFLYIFWVFEGILLQARGSVNPPPSHWQWSDIALYCFFLSAFSPPSQWLLSIFTHFHLKKYRSLENLTGEK